MLEPSAEWHAQNALKWVNRAIPKYSDEAKATVMAAMISSMVQAEMMCKLAADNAIALSLSTTDDNSPLRIEIDNPPSTADQPAA